MMKRLLDLVAINAHAVRTTSVDPLQKFKFRLTIPGLPAGIGFHKVSGLTHELEVIEYDEGGFDYTHKLAGKQKVGEVVAERGVYANTDLHAVLRRNLTNPNLRSTVIFEQLDRFGRPVKTYKLAEAWVSKWEGSDADATSGDVAIEKITIQFEYFL